MYYVAIVSKYSQQQGPFQINFRDRTHENDVCTGATAVLSVPFTYSDYLHDYTSELSTCYPDEERPAMWFTRAGDGKQYLIETCKSCSGLDNPYYTRIEVYTTCYESQKCVNSSKQTC